MHRGFVKSWRKVLDNAIVTDSFAFHLMHYCILRANYTDKTIIFDGEELVVKRGTFITSLAKLEEATGIKRSTLRNRLKLLVRLKIITHTGDNRKTVVTVLNYDTYQPDEASVLLPVARTATVPAIRTATTDKKVKKDNNIYILRKAYLREKNWKVDSLTGSDFSRIASAAKKILTSTKGDTAQACEAISWISQKADKEGWSWTLETVVKKMPDFLNKLPDKPIPPQRNQLGRILDNGKWEHQGLLDAYQAKLKKYNEIMEGRNNG